VPEVAVLENGDVGELGAAAEDALRKSGRVHSGRVHVYAQRAVPPSVLHERAGLAARGAAHVVVPIDARGRPAGEITLSTRGVVDETLDAHVLAAARSAAQAAIEELADGEAAGEAVIAETARNAVRRALERALGFKPSTSVTVLRVSR
jgi:mRNA degradation ribonuclease J1/J2